MWEKKTNTKCAVHATTNRKNLNTFVRWDLVPTLSELGQVKKERNVDEKLGKLGHVSVGFFTNTTIQAQQIYKAARQIDNLE